MWRLFLLFFPGLLIQVNHTLAERIVVSGNAAGKWNADTVRIINDITVSPDSVLMISPGVVVEFYGHYKITVKGNVIAVGNEDHLIKFTVYDTTGFADSTTVSGGWHGIVFNDLPGSADSSKFSYCIFEFGKAVDTDSAGRYGGAFRIYGFSRISFNHCIFRNNYAYHWGGAVYAKLADIEIRNSKFYDNSCGQAGIPYGYGGGLCFVRSNPDISYNYFEDNLSTGIGGAVSLEYSDAIVQYNNFFNNKSALGGALGYLRSYPDNFVSNNLFDQNEALFFGGGIACIRANTNFSNNTVVNNVSTYGGGFYANDSAFPASYNTIFYNNFAYEGVEVYIWDVYSAPDFYYCNVPGGIMGFSGSGGQEGYHGIFVFNLDTIPMFKGTGDHPHALEKDSPLVDAGTRDTMALHIPLNDFAGNPRIFNDRIDIGAYEWNPGEGFRHNKKKSVLSASPNPCNQSVEISFILQSPDRISIRIYDMQGKPVMDLGSRKHSDGKYSVKWDLHTQSGEKAEAGTYLCTLMAENYSESIKIVVQ